MLPGVGIAVAGLLASAAAAAPEVNPVNINNETISDVTSDGTTATASFTFRTDRSVKDHDGVNVDATWLQSGYSAADYQIRVTKTSGTNPTGDSLGTWLSLSSNRTWSLARSTDGSSSATLTVEIRDAAAPNTVRDSATYTLTAEKQASGGGTVDWDDISATRTTSSISVSNGAETMGSSGTLSIAYSGSGLTLTVYVNGVSQGTDTSVPVSSGDTVHFNASGTGFVNGETRTGTITVSGLYSDTINVSLERSTL